ncbi:MAG: hypothetical protein ACOYNI_01210 [Acidimicrobiia bacterium]
MAPSDQMWPDDPELELAARRVRLEREEEQAELEEMEEEERDRSLDLPFALLELQWRGDRVRVLLADRTFEGIVVHVGDDLCTVQTGPEALVDVRLDHVGAVAVVERARVGGRAKISRDPRRFVARVREVAEDGSPEVELGAVGNVRVTGTVVRVHADHVVCRGRDRSEWLVPLAALIYVVRNPELGRRR